MELGVASQWHGAKSREPVTPLNPQYVPIKLSCLVPCFLAGLRSRQCASVETGRSGTLGTGRMMVNFLAYGYRFPKVNIHSRNCFYSNKSLQATARPLQSHCTSFLQDQALSCPKGFTAGCEIQALTSSLGAPPPLPSVSWRS